jgi:hypothetical protein
VFGSPDGTLVRVVPPSLADWSRLARHVRWALTLALVILLIQSAFWDARVPWALKFGVASVAILSAWRPGVGLLAVAGLVPFGAILASSVWQTYPFALSEALVLAFLAGYLWWQHRGALEQRAANDRLAVPSRLFALVVLASCLVQFAVLQVWHDYPLRYAAQFTEYLATEYLTTVADPRPWVDGRGFVWTAAMLLEGIALLRCASTLCRRDPALARRLTHVMIMAGAGVAMLSFYERGAAASNLGQSITSVMSIRRGSPAIPSIDSVGPYFMLLAFVALGTAATSRASLLPGLTAGVIIIGATWLTHARSAISAGVGVLAAGVLWLAMTRGLRLSASRALAIVGAATIAVVVFLVVSWPLYLFSGDVNRLNASTSLYYRFLLATTAVRMLLSHPSFGVGIGQYAQWYGAFSPPGLPDIFNAHNYLLWVSAELGLMGVAIFLWILGATLARIWSRVRVDQPNYWFLGTLAGLVAFIITWAGGQPLEIPQVAYTFWILLGLLAGYSTDNEPAAADSLRQAPLARIALGVTILVVVGSVPFRAARAIADIDLARVSYGFYNSNTADNRSFRWAGPRVTFFMRRSVRAINLPLAAKLPDTPHGAQVDVVLDGTATDHIMLSNREWHDVEINAPRSERRFWRVDLHVTPLGVPANLPENMRRVAIGQISIKRQEEPGTPDRD